MPFTIQKQVDSYQWCVYIQAMGFDDKKIHFGDITACKRIVGALGSNGPCPATVNFPSMGETNPENAAIFAEAIMEAVRIAKCMDLGIEPSLV